MYPSALCGYKALTALANHARSPGTVCVRGGLLGFAGVWRVF